MTQRERVLAIAVGGLLLVVALNWGFNKYRAAVKQRNNTIASLNDNINQQLEAKIQGELAAAQMDRYLARSLPADVDRAQSDYQQWLFSLVKQHDIGNANVNPSKPLPVRGLYQRLRFQLKGDTTFPKFIDLLHSFYAKDYLHQIRVMDLTPNKAGGYTIDLSIDAMALADRPEDAPAPGTDSWRVDADAMAYRDAILNRNFFSPPNQAPQYVGSKTLEATVARDSALPLVFKDAEGHPFEVELIGDVPDFVSLEPRSKTLRVNSAEKGEFSITAKAKDQGYPPRSAEWPILVKVVDPPPVVKPPEPEIKPEFDDASQTVLTALVQGGGDWTAWMRVMTRDKTLKLRIGDEFEVGTVKGKVLDVTSRFVEIQIEDRQFTLQSGGVLGEAARRALED